MQIDSTRARRWIKYSMDSWGYVYRNSDGKEVLALGEEGYDKYIGLSAKKFDKLIDKKLDDLMYKKSE